MSITAAVLCGGQGTRLRPVIGNLPKCLAPVAGKPFIKYILSHLRDEGISNVVLCTGYGGVEVENEFGRGLGYILLGNSGPYISIRFSKEDKPLGTGGALLNALPMLDTDPVLVVNGDTYCPFKLKPLLDEHVGFGWEVTTLTRMFTRMQISTGIRLMSKSFLNWLKIASSEQAKEGALIDLDQWGGYHYAKHERSCGFPFLDIGTEGGYLGAEAFLREQGAIT